MKRREFLKRAGIVAGASAFSFLPKISFAAGKPVDAMTLLTANASFDPVRPEMGRLISQACKKIGWKDGMWAIWCILKYNLRR